MDTDSAFQRLVTRSIIPDGIRDHISYDPENGVFSRKTPLHRYRSGYVFTKKNKRGYLVIRFGGRMYFAHRIGWFLMTGNQPPVILDHRDGNTSNNRWSNLRAATCGQSNSNRHYTNLRMPMGVRLLESGRYGVRISANNRRHCLGVFETVDAAVAAYLEAAEQYHGEFARRSAAP